MTREEHIIYLKNLRTALKLANNFSNETMESLNKAIEALEAGPCVDAISREAVLAMSDYIGETPTLENPYAKPEEVVRVKDIMKLPPVVPAQSLKPMSNKQWIDFLVKAWDISRTSAKDMLHVMMSVKKEDNFKKQFNKPRATGK
jgi:hypothetical protein